MSAPKLLFATTNAGKLDELRRLVGDAVQVVSPSDVHGLPVVDEDQESFEGNAQKKAAAYAEASGLPALADDSGLCVPALGGLPGVQSARYAPDDGARIQRLLAELRQAAPAPRDAFFRCALCLAVPGGSRVIEVASCPGRITEAPRGSNGFGYDPIFLVPELGKTFAEMTAEEKSRVSHRGLAFQKMRPHLLSLLRPAA